MGVDVLGTISKKTVIEQDVVDAYAALSQLRKQSPFAQVLAHMLKSASNGETCVISSAPKELSTEEAAEYLNVSRPYVSRLIKHGILVSRKVGNRHRISLDALTEYQKRHQEAQGNYVQDVSSRQQDINELMDKAAVITKEDEDEIADLLD